MLVWFHTDATRRAALPRQSDRRKLGMRQRGCLAWERPQVNPVVRTFQDGASCLRVAREVNDRFDSLTERERQVYQLLAEGNTNMDLANRLDLSVHTVETHHWRIMEKRDLHSIAEVVLNAVRRGLVTLSSRPNWRRPRFWPNIPQGWRRQYRHCRI
jgi:DNA-binding NarL/FixJ family response regulator